MTVLRRLTVALSLPAFLALWAAGLGASPRFAAAGDPPMNPAKPDAGMADPAMADPPKADPVPDPAGGKKIVPVSIEDAESELGHLKDHLKNNKADNNTDILAALEAVANAYHHMIPVADDAEPGVKDKFEARKKKFIEDAEKEFKEAYEKKRVKGTSKVNDRDDVNIAAVKLLGLTNSDRADTLTNWIIAILTTSIFKAKDYDPPTAIYDESFKAIALLNDHQKGLPFVREWLKYDNSPNAPEKVKAAFDAVILFKDVPGKERFDIVSKLTTNFVGVENAAEINKDKNQRAQKVVWDKIKPSVIKALQIFCLTPKNKAGTLLASVKDLKAWFDDHDKMNDAAWKDAPKPAK